MHGMLTRDIEVTFRDVLSETGVSRSVVSRVTQCLRRTRSTRLFCPPLFPLQASIMLTVSTKSASNSGCSQYLGMSIVWKLTNDLAPSDLSQCLRACKPV